MTTDLTPFQQTKVAQAQQVLLLLFEQPDLTIAEACKQTGITERSYRYWLAKGDTAISNTREMIDQAQRQLISELALAKFKTLRMLMQDAIDVMTTPSDRAKLFATISEELGELQSVYNVRPGIEEEAQAFLKKGPTIEKKESRFVSIDIEETETGFRIGVNEPKDIVDGEISD